MNSRGLAHVGLSLLGVYALVQALVTFPSLVTWGSALMQFQQGRAVLPLVTIAPFAALILIGCLLVTQPVTVARWLSPPSDPDSSPEVGIGLATFLFAAAGILIFASAIPDLIQAGLAYAAGGSQGPSLPWLTGHVVRALLGLFLFFRPAAVLDFWQSKQVRRNRRSGDSPAA